MNIKHEARILILDNETESREAMRLLLSEHFTEVEAADSYKDAISKIEQGSFDVVISNFKVDGKNGLELRKWQLAHQPSCQFILITGYSNDPEIVEHLKTDHFKVLQKPAHPNELIFPLKRDFPKKEAA